MGNWESPFSHLLILSRSTLMLLGALVLAFILLATGSAQHWPAHLQESDILKDPNVFGAFFYCSYHGHLGCSLS